jgi:hypothetical protein
MALRGGASFFSTTPMARGLEDFFESGNRWIWVENEMPVGNFFLLNFQAILQEEFSSHVEKTILIM